MRKILVVLVAVAALVVVGPASANTLSAYDKAAVEHLVYLRSDCADCGLAPDFGRATGRFASDYGRKGGVGVAYLVVRYPTVDRTRTFQWLFSFDSYVGRWRILEQAFKGTFMCPTAVLANPNYRIAYQLSVLRRVARCATR